MRKLNFYVINMQTKLKNSSVIQIIITFVPHKGVPLHAFIPHNG